MRPAFTLVDLVCMLIGYALGLFCLMVVYVCVHYGRVVSVGFLVFGWPVFSVLMRRWRKLWQPKN